MNFEQAMKSPGRVFESPEQLEASTDFDAAQKRALLWQWKNQLEQLLRATHENMPGPESDGAGAECLRRVTNALIRLDTPNPRDRG